MTSTRSPYVPISRTRRWRRASLRRRRRLFHVTFQRVPDAVVWDKSVTTYDVLDAAGHKAIGRIYLDMHPREGKDKWFSSGPVVPGIRGRQMPEGMLICNFSGGVAGDPGLMEYSEVVTFFHEFGHLMHHILGSQNEWSAAGRLQCRRRLRRSRRRRCSRRCSATPPSCSPSPRTTRPARRFPPALVAKMNAAERLWARPLGAVATLLLRLLSAGARPARRRR